MSTTTTNSSTPHENSPHSSSNQSTPRNLSIRFAPLPDPRASRANLPSHLGQLDVWWKREEKPDGTWGDYRLVLRRPNGQIVAIDDLDPTSDERTQALECYRQQKPSKPLIVHRNNSWDIESNQNSHLLRSPNIILSDSQTTLPKQLLPTPCTQASNLANSSSNSNLHSAGSNASLNYLALTPTASCDSTHSNYSFGSNHKPPSSASLAKKMLDALKKPISRNSHRLTPTNSLPMQSDYFGAPLCKSRSADSITGSIRKRFSFGLPKNNQILRRTRSKEEESSTHSNRLGFDEPPVRRRANYPPVAQRKVHMGGGRGGAGKVVLTEEPDFVEWKPAAAAASPGAVASSRPDHLVEDDGSGMAWLRRRKKEREERARREEEERAQVLGNASRPAPLATIHETQLGSNDLNKDQGAAIELGLSHLSGDMNLELSPQDEKKDDDRDSSASSISQSSILSRDGAHASGGTRTSTSSATLSSKNSTVEDDEDLNEEELKEEERLKALALSQSPFVKGASEVYRDREHHQILRKSTEIN